MMQPSKDQALQREEPMPCTPKHKSKPRLAPPVVPWSCFGARQEKGNPENFDLMRSTSTTYFGDENCACKKCDNELRRIVYAYAWITNYKVMSVGREQVRVEAR